MNKRFSTSSRSKGKASSMLVYVYECGLCGKKFTRSTMDGTLRPHKDKNGYACYGIIGNFVESKVKIT
jgi:hypothetical protein